MVTQTARYALNVLGFLVRAEAERVRSEDIARQTGIPANYLSKILNQLRKQGVVEGEKGWGGGFRIRPEALQRPIGEIVTGGLRPCIRRRWRARRRFDRRHDRAEPSQRGKRPTLAASARRNQQDGAAL